MMIKKYKLLDFNWLNITYTAFDKSTLAGQLAWG